MTKTRDLADLGGGFIQAGTGATQRTVEDKLKDVVSVKDFGAVGDGTTDDTAAIQAAIDAAAAANKPLHFPENLTYRTTDTLTISDNKVSIYGNESIIEYEGTTAALAFDRITGTDNYPVNFYLEGLNFTISNGTATAGINVRTSYSNYKNVGVSITSGVTSGAGFVLIGDEDEGSGPYYNLFENCTVQSQSSSTDHTGVKFTSTSPGYRGPNANTWVGGRVGQCLVGFKIEGYGNSFFNPTVENASGAGTSFDFSSAGTNKSYGNTVFGAYLENASVGFDLKAQASNNAVYSPFMTGVSTTFQDAGTSNTILTSLAFGSQIQNGLRFGSSGTTLDTYEEGTWTPTLVGGTTAGDYSITATGAKYTRVGDVVHIAAKMAITINTAGTGTLRFGGLPYAKGSNVFFSGSVGTKNITFPASTSGLSIQPWATSSDSTFIITTNRSGTTQSALTCTQLASNSEVYISLTYFV